jgi:DNA-binding MarR family transcriptional regulator
VTSSPDYDSGVNSPILTWRSLHLADGAVCDALNGRLAEVDCSLVEHDVMAWLYVSDGRRLRMLELADRVRVTPGGLTRIVDRLVERGWVTRDTPAENRREVYAMLTREGITAYRRARVVYVRVIEESFAAHLDERELLALGRIAEKVLKHAGLPRSVGRGG